MNKSKFITTGGYPLKAERLQEQQTAYQIFNSFGSLAGNLTIISGCETIGTTVQNGFVFIDGELLEFRGAVATSTSRVIIIEESVNRGFENGIIKEVYTIRYATFGTNETSWLWTDFKRSFETKNIPANLVTQLEKVDTKEDKTIVAALIERIEALEARTSPLIKVISGEAAVSATAQGYNSSNFTKNYVYVYPPAGYTMSNLSGFISSLAEINFSGDVNGDDTLWCKHSVGSDRITVICSNSETRSASRVNYLAVWIK